MVQPQLQARQHETGPSAFQAKWDGGLDALLDCLEGKGWYLSWGDLRNKMVCCHLQEEEEELPARRLEKMELPAPKQNKGRSGHSWRRAKKPVPSPAAEREVLPARVPDREVLPAQEPKREVLPAQGPKREEPLPSCLKGGGTAAFSRAGRGGASAVSSAKGGGATFVSRSIMGGASTGSSQQGQPLHLLLRGAMWINPQCGNHPDGLMYFPTESRGFMAKVECL
ncbi:UNVERIFIED_CONTAM: hypothetical protein FKN15_008744 [Acipenser sinensis]